MIAAALILLSSKMGLFAGLIGLNTNNARNQIMSVRSEGMRETMQLIKQAIYDLQVGPSEIVTSVEQPAIVNVKFDSRRGAPLEVAVTVPSTYSSIYDALQTAYNA